MEKEFDPYPWLALLHANVLSHAQKLDLLRITGSAHGALHADPSVLSSLGIAAQEHHALLNPNRAVLEPDLNWLAQPHHELVVLGAPQYPPMLRAIPDPPLALFVDGDPEVLSHPQIAMVGSRNPTAQGRENAALFARYLCGCGFAITSGLARGIDAASHFAALKAGGFSVAVCGTGLNTVYPTQHKRLAAELAESGAVVSEFPCNTPPHRYNFPRRNRIISGLAAGTLVIEAAHRSGSLITARLAGEQGREIFAIPGSIHNPMARGCHRLIRDGARLVESGVDIIEELGNLARFAMSDSPVPADTPLPSTGLPDTDYDKLLNSIGFEPSSVDQLCERTGLTADAVSSMLLILELRGYVKIADGGRYLSSI